MKKTNKNVIDKIKNLGEKDKKDLLFILIMAFFPILQFIVFYFFVNINTVIMAFQTYEVGKGYVFYGVNNFIRFFNEFTNDNVLLVSLKNSAIYFVTSVFVGISLTIIFSYYIYKKRFLHSVFKVMLFLPSILSSIVMVLLYKYFMDNAIPQLLSKITGRTIAGLASSKSTKFITILFYCIWSGFGTGILMYSGAMNSISESMVEAGKIDGTNTIQEFWYITLPMIFPTLSTFIVVACASFFIADMNLFSFYGVGSERYVFTVGYYLLKYTKLAEIPEYPYLACLGLICTIITVPITFLIRRLLERFGPSVD